MNQIKQTINECHIPSYMQDILTNNYCPYFLRMSMLREDDDYTFRYQLDRYTKIEVSRLDTLKKLILLRTMISLNEKNEDRLIMAKSYLIEPELVYSIDNNVNENYIRLLFYPDFKNMDFNKKIIHFADKLRDNKDRDEGELIEQFKGIAEKNDWNHAKRFLDKNIMRMETAS